MNNKIIFIHGMFQNARSWNNWTTYFGSKGYECIVKSWPYHDGDPVELRNNPPVGLGELRLKEVIEEFAQLATANPDAILIGHSVGGLIVQKLINRGLGRAGVAINSVAPNRMLTLDWSTIKNISSIVNPLKGDEPAPMDAKGFHENFANAMSFEDSIPEFEATATFDSRNVLRDCMKEDGLIDLEKPHVPLLFIAGDIDEIIPPELNSKNAESYTDKKSSTEFKVFTKRGHYICGQPDWEEVANYINGWIERKVQPLVSPAITTPNPTVTR